MDIEPLMIGIRKDSMIRMDKVGILNDIDMMIANDYDMSITQYDPLPFERSSQHNY
jgi:hypothetical protein